MRALLLEVDQAWLDERRRLGQDRHDEVWDGVYHVVPSPTVWHQAFEYDLQTALRKIALPLGLRVFHELDILDRRKGETNYRQPDISVVSRSDIMESGRGINGHAELVVEVLSPNDGSYEKFAFYAACGIPEYWIVHPQTRVFEVYVLTDGVYDLVQPDANGVVHAPRFDLKLSIVENDGPKLHVEWAGGSADV